MTKATNLEELQRLVKKMTGKESNADSIADAIAEIADAYSGGGSGGATIQSAALYPDSEGSIKAGAITMSDGSIVNITLEHIEVFTVKSAEGSEAGTTALTVTNKLASGNTYVYVTDRSPSIPAIGEIIDDGIDWDGKSDIVCDDGAQLTIVEVDANKRAVKAGKVVAIIKY